MSGAVGKGGKIVTHVGRQVKPLLSVDRTEARRRVLNLYKAWYRQIPYVGKFTTENESFCSEIN